MYMHIKFILSLDLVYVLWQADMNLDCKTQTVG
jgi:hypothetical protein